VRRFDRFRCIKPWEDPSSIERATIELNAFNMVERLIDGRFSWEELKRATLLPQDLLERILDRLELEGKITGVEVEEA